jgi:hypothetical protein
MAQQTNNPYSAPVHAPQKPVEHVAADNVIDFILLAKKWERYRLIYNAVLVVWTIILSVGLFGVPSLKVVLLIVFGALVANFFFCLGPGFDGYIQWIFGSRSWAIGMVILVLGTLFTMLLAGGFLLEMQMLAKNALVLATG